MISVLWMLVALGTRAGLVSGGGKKIMKKCFVDERSEDVGQTCSS